MSDSDIPEWSHELYAEYELGRDDWSGYLHAVSLGYTGLLIIWAEEKL